MSINNTYYNPNGTPTSDVAERLLFIAASASSFMVSSSGKTYRRRATEKEKNLINKIRALKDKLKDIKVT